MSYQAIKEYIIAILKPYKTLNKKGKTDLLNHAAVATGLSRKHLIRLLGQTQEMIARKKPSGRKCKYPKELLLPHIRYLWKQMEQVTAERMKVAFPDWLPRYDHPECTPQIRAYLETMSVSTLERFLRTIQSESTASKGLSTTGLGSPSRHMKNKIPLNTFDVRITRPGFTQTDTVAHCGTNVGGQYAHSITLTDIDSTWTENRAIFSKNQHEVRRQFADLDHHLPFELLAVNFDNGSEFINTQMLQFGRREHGKKEIAFTRSRPYRKNDNCYVEQKNYTHVRELFGYERFDDQSLVPIMNDIYKNCWNPLHNFFIPTYKLKEKTRIGAKIIKKYDPPKTPYARLMESSALSDEQKDQLRKQKQALNPFKLKADLEAKLQIFFDQLRKLKSREAA